MNCVFRTIRRSARCCCNLHRIINGAQIERGNRTIYENDSSLSRDRKQTHPVVQILPACLASAEATLKVMTSLWSRTLFCMIPNDLSCNVQKSKRSDVVRGEQACMVQTGWELDWWLTDICPLIEEHSFFFLHQATRPEPICRSETAAACGLYQTSGWGVGEYRPANKFPVKIWSVLSCHVSCVAPETAASVTWPKLKYLLEELVQIPTVMSANK